MVDPLVASAQTDIFRRQIAALVPGAQIPVGGETEEQREAAARSFVSLFATGSARVRPALRRQPAPWRPSASRTSAGPGRLPNHPARAPWP